MTKAGFICEGRTEQIILQSESFTQLLAHLNIVPVNIINAEGSGNLLPHNISGYIDSLEKQDAQIIIILTDLDKDVCITKTKKRISSRPQDIVIISVKKIEAWFLAETTAMRDLLGEPNFNFEVPENETDPFDVINSLLMEHTGRGIGKSKMKGAKIKLVIRMLEKGFNMQQASSHPNCPSAKYFIDKLTQAGGLA